MWEKLKGGKQCSLYGKIDILHSNQTISKSKISIYFEFDKRDKSLSNKNINFLLIQNLVLNIDQIYIYWIDNKWTYLPTL